MNPAKQSKRRCYKASFKLEVVAVAKEKGNRAAGRQYGIDESTIRGWRKNEAAIKKMPSGKMANRAGKAKHPTMEENLKSWVVAQRSNGRAVSTLQIRMKAISMVKEMNDDSFGASPSWCHRFMRRHKLSVRAPTAIGQRLPADWEDKQRSFKGFVQNVIHSEKYPLSKIGNMDEVPLTFDAPLSRTVNPVGEKTVKIVTTGNEKTSFTVVLSCMADGTKLPPMCIFKRVTMPKEVLPSNCIVTVNKKGWMNEEVMQLWAEKCWRKRPGAFFDPKGMLVFDSMRAHLTDHTKKTFTSQKTKLAVIPGGLTCKLQPLDVGVNKSFKVFVRQEWEAWMSEGLHTSTATGRMRRAEIATVCSWVVKAWHKVSKQTVINAFKKCEIGYQNNMATAEEEDFEEEDNGEEQDTVLDEDVLALFHSDSEDEDFDGFDPSDL